jgi:DNA repair exonuclease SbcCD nuclease subunit
MKFAHLADCHIGSWKDPKLRDANTEAFKRAIGKCIEHKVDFIIIGGDLFNTSMPSIDSLKMVVQKLQILRQHNIPVYLIAGSHDYSPSGKTMLDVLESADLFVNVAKGEVIEDKLKLRFTVDKKTGAKITGMLGKRGSLEKHYYENLMRENLEQEEGYKIFIFHSLLAELKPKGFEDVESQPISYLPKNFNYYAGGHPHFVFHTTLPDYGIIAYPGPLFPNNFRELEQLSRGGFYLIENGEVHFEPLQIFNTYSISIDCEHKTPEQVKQDILKEIGNQEFFNTIITIRLSGTLASGKPSDIPMKEIFEHLYEKGAYFVMKNTHALSSTEFEEIKVNQGSVDDIESSIIREHLQQLKVFSAENEEQMIHTIMTVLNTEKAEGEKAIDFQNRLISEMNKLFT